MDTVKIFAFRNHRKIFNQVKNNVYMFEFFKLKTIRKRGTIRNDHRHTRVRHEGGIKNIKIYPIAKFKNSRLNSHI